MNHPVSKGNVLCFSYIEHEYLCESLEGRTALLAMDFIDLGLENCDDTEEDTVQPVAKQHWMTSKNNKMMMTMTHCCHLLM